MGSKKPQQQLDVYLHGQKVGQLRSQNAVLSFLYDEIYLKRERASTLSISLPLQSTPFDHPTSSAFFSGLLPDEGVRYHLAKYLQISEKNSFELLKAVGGECAGAVSLYPEGELPSHGSSDYLILSEDDADKLLLNLSKQPFLAGNDHIRLSCAGAQDKLMIAFVNGKIAIPMGLSVSTHIIKPSIKHVDSSVHNEFFCMKLAHELGLPVAQPEIIWIKNIAYYLVKRYDREMSGEGRIARLHQEDFCQALHIAPDFKYENEGGPTIIDCFKLLDTRIQSGSMPGKAKLTLMNGIIYNFLIGNGDAHGKNFSILYKGKGEELAPFYDLLSTAVYSNAFKAKMAMKISGKYKFRDVSMREWQSLSEDLGFRPDFIKKQIHLLAEPILAHANALRDSLMNDPRTASHLYDEIIKVIKTNRDKMLHIAT